MTISNTYLPVRYYTTEHGTEYPFPWAANLDTQIAVYKEDIVTLEVTKLALGVDYTVSGLPASEGGTVVISPALGTGYKITVAREVPQLQGVDLSNQGGWFPEVHEAEFDELVMMIQDLQEQIDRKIGLSIVEGGDPDDYLGLAKDYAGQSEASAQESAASADIAEDAYQMTLQIIDNADINEVNLNMGRRVEATSSLTIGRRA